MALKKWYLKNFKEGQWFTATIDGTNVVGRIRIQNGHVYLCQNIKDGTKPGNRFMYNFAYSWAFPEFTIEGFVQNQVKGHNFKISNLRFLNGVPAGYKDTKHNIKPLPVLGVINDHEVNGDLKNDRIILNNSDRVQLNRGTFHKLGRNTGWIEGKTSDYMPTHVLDFKVICEPGYLKFGCTTISKETFLGIGKAMDWIY